MNAYEITIQSMDEAKVEQTMALVHRMVREWEAEVEIAIASVPYNPRLNVSYGY